MKAVPQPSPAPRKPGRGLDSPSSFEKSVARQALRKLRAALARLEAHPLVAHPPLHSSPGRETLPTGGIRMRVPDPIHLDEIAPDNFTRPGIQDQVRDWELLQEEAMKAIHAAATGEHRSFKGPVTGQAALSGIYRA